MNSVNVGFGQERRFAPVRNFRFTLNLGHVLRRSEMARRADKDSCTMLYFLPIF